jgi:hypothetical protein
MCYMTLSETVVLDKLKNSAQPDSTHSSLPWSCSIKGNTVRRRDKEADTVLVCDFGLPGAGPRLYGDFFGATLLIIEVQVQRKSMGQFLAPPKLVRIRGLNQFLLAAPSTTTDTTYEGGALSQQLATTTPAFLYRRPMARSAWHERLRHR